MPFALEAEDVEILESAWRPAGQATWFSPLVRLPGLDGEEVHAVEWTTGSRSGVRRASTSPRSASGACCGALHARPGAQRAGRQARASTTASGRPTRPGATPCACAGSGPPRARGRRRARPWPCPCAAGERWLPLVHRTRAAVRRRRIVGGGGFQFFRSWGYSPAKPDRLIGTMDIDIPIRTDDFGDWWERAPSRRAQGRHLRPGLRHRQRGRRPGAGHVLGRRRGASSRAGTPRPASTSRPTAARASPSSSSSTTSPARPRARATRCRARASCSSPSSRCRAARRRPAAGTPSSARCRRARRRSTARCGARPTAARTWAPTGEALTGREVRRAALRPAPGGERRLLLRHRHRALPLGRRGRRAGRRSPPCRRARVLEIDVKGAAGEVWACVDGVGLFRSDDHGATWTAEEEGYDIQTFAISPHDRKRILIAGANAPEADGAADLDRRRRDLERRSRRCPSRASPSPSTPTSTPPTPTTSSTPPTRCKVFAARYQHFGRSTDGGQTFVWASNDFDYNFVYDIAVDPADWTQMALTMQDRMLVFTENGHDWVWDDAVDRGDQGRGRGRRPTTAAHTDAGRGALILRNGSAPPDHHRRRQRREAGDRRSTPPEGDNPIGTCTRARPRRQGRLVRGRRHRRRGPEPRLHRALALRARRRTGC